MTVKRKHLFGFPGHEVPLKNIVRAENCSLYDADGNRFVDLESGVWCTPIGHSHPRILAVMQAQAARIAHSGFAYMAPVVDEAADKVLALHGLDGGACAFLASGSEAVEYGVRVAQAIKPDAMLLTMADSYFGAYGSAAVRLSDQWYCFDWMACAHCPPDRTCGADCDRWAAIPFDRIGGFVFEPGSSSGLVRFPPHKLITSMVQAVQTDAGLVMVNEVTTGMGRTGRWFGYEHYGLAPDIVAMGKGMGNGYPVSVTAVSAEVADRIPGGQILYGQSHLNDPLGAAIAMAVIDVMEEEKLVERGKKMGARLVEGLESIRARTGRIRAIRARGLMIAMELEAREDVAYAAAVRRALVKSGFVLTQRPNLNLLRMDPALTIEKRDVRGFLDRFERILNEIGEEFPSL